jgi:DNA topoisomerase-3
MEVAEQLYNKGFISYPRTETDRFDRGMDLRALVEKQTVDNRWGGFAQNLMNGAFKQPREGTHDDKAHPPIHPIAHKARDFDSEDHARVYEFVARRFLACCAEDAIGKATDIELEYGDEGFHAHGVIVMERNYLDVYPYENWTGNMLPKFTLGEEFEPDEALMTEGKTSAPGYLTEPELIALMDANGIGTDATMAEHIAKIKARDYVTTEGRGGGQADQGDREIENNRGRGRGRGRGGRGGRAGRGGAVAAEAPVRRNGAEIFIPTTLGVALVEGYDGIDFGDVGFPASLSKPFLRKEMEMQMKAICEGRKSRQDVIRASIAQYRQVYQCTKEQIHVLKAVSPRFHSVKNMHSSLSDGFLF